MFILRAENPLESSVFTVSCTPERNRLDVKQKAKVIGIVITSCPCCGNPINFDRQVTKVCAYCEELVHIDLDKVEVNLHGPVTPEGRRVKISMN